MKKVLGIIALAACMACTEKPKELMHPELEDLDLWACIDELETNYILFNESGEDFPAITRYAWADIDGDGQAELFLGSAADEFPAISAAFALGGEEPACIGYQDGSHEMRFFKEGVVTLGTGVVRYNYREQRDRLQESKLIWELAIEETKEMYLELEGDFSDICLSRPGAEAEYPEEEDIQALLAEFTEQYELEPDWQPLESLYEMKTVETPAAQIQFNAKRFELVSNDITGEDYDVRLQNPQIPAEFLRFTGYYEDALDVMQENGNNELIAEYLHDTCWGNSVSVEEDPDYAIYDSYISSLEYYNPENGYFFNYEADAKGETVYGAICVKPAPGSGNVLVMRAESPSEKTRDRFVEQFPALTFCR